MMAIVFSPLLHALPYPSLARQSLRLAVRCIHMLLGLTARPSSYCSVTALKSLVLSARVQTHQIEYVGRLRQLTEDARRY